MTLPSREAQAVNLVAGFSDFMRRWMRQDEASHRQLDFAISEGGNINFEGTSACNSSVLLTRWHPSFLSCIEPGVRELVGLLVTEWDCVTYSSCEGHHATVDQPARVRHVRMVSCSAGEHTRLRERLQRLVMLTNAAAHSDEALLVWREATVITTQCLEAPGLDLIFAPRSAICLLYWQDLEAVYRHTVAHLREAGTEVSAEPTVRRPAIGDRSPGHLPTHCHRRYGETKGDLE